jgi:uncharacterized protein
MRTVFADAGYWIALLNPSDGLHHSAISISAKIAPFSLVTSEMVLTEVLNSFSRKGSGLRTATLNLMRDFKTDVAVDVVPQTSALFDLAFDLYSQRLDQAWSHTDCASFCIMQQQDIREALTHDRHFEQAGFIALLR